MSLSAIDQNVLILVNTVARVSITCQDSDGNLVDPNELTLTVMDLGGTVELAESYPADVDRLVHSATGRFYIDWGDQTDNDETDEESEWLFDWAIQLVTDGRISHSIQKVKVIPAVTASLLPEFRQMIDKAKKITSTSEDIFLGYTDAQLVTYLEGGLQTINAYQPSVTFTMNTFPHSYKQILLDAGLVTGVTSQQLFAIDTDIPNYNDQGTSFVINHQPQLAAFLNQMTQRLDKLIPMMKLQCISSGSVYTQAGGSYRLNQVMEAAPSGSLFRNMFFRG